MPSSSSRRGMTFVELLVAMTLSMILIYGMAVAFGRVGQAASDGRAAIEMANQTRNVMNRLQLDLEGVTVPMRNWTSGGGGRGYFELIEGTRKEYTDINNPITQARLIGDMDDVLMFTTRSQSEPFRGRVVSSTGAVAMVASPLAEVVYAVTQRDPLSGTAGLPFVAPLTTDTLARDFYLHRRAFVIRPDLNQPNGYVLRVTNSDISVLFAQYLQFLNANDLSVRVSLTQPAGGPLQMDLIANSLEDLSRRENRFAHRMLGSAGAPLLDNNINSAFPHTIFVPNLAGGLQYNPGFATMFTQGDTVLTSHAIGFDAKVYDPNAPIYLSLDGTTAILPSDPGFYVTPSQGGTAIINPLAPATLRGRGAFVDLGYARAAFQSGLFDDPERDAVRSLFSDYPELKSQLRPYAVTAGIFTYDSWSDFYERNNFSENGNALVDEGTDGIDNNGTGGVDEFAEQETAPPYATALRGVQVTLRIYETDTRQVRQMSVVNDFIPE